ncbi:DMT family transporter [Crenobacter sp. SG2303]|uniref:DMT family transporter n=1 Tax=Crenobacter oryzisoli TaxID=3056844 RepID=A0ABT7XKB0_9NEIS|nr:DMT family transporter [Crenobacter sp. SG2303]MDN0074219.1 DMT family transporter [Crenobacter sp. SG2303]
MLFAAPFFLLLARQSGGAANLERRDWTWILALGLLGYYLSSLFDFFSLLTISAALERMTLFLYPTLVLLLSTLFLKKRYPLHVWGAVLLSYLGVALAFAHDLAESTLAADAWKGLGWVLASTFTYALYLIGTGEVVGRIGATRMAALGTLVACIAVLVHFSVTEPVASILHLPWQVYAIGLAMGVFSTALPVWCLSQAIRLLGAGRTASVGTLGLALTLLMSWGFLGEALSLEQVAGAALVVLGVTLANRQKGSR